MNRKLVLFCAATLPLFLLAVVAQSIQFQQLRREVVTKEREQYEWVEKNKKVLAGVTVLRAPQRIETLAQDDPQLLSVGADGTLKVRFQAAGQEK